MAQKSVASCTVCSKEFLPRAGKTGKYCSMACYREWQRGPDYVTGRPPRYRGKCLNCKTDIYGGSASICRDGRRSEKMFCNRACYDRYRIAEREKYIASTKTNCRNCEAELKVSNKGQAPRTYCNARCRAEAIKPDPQKCVNCKCMFSAIKWRKGGKGYVRATNSATCGAECHNLWIRNDPERKRKISLAFRGKKHPNWQGGPAEKNGRRYRGPGWTRIRREIRKRDGYTCQDCGIHESDYNKSLDVHHKIPFNQFGGNSQKANNPKNLISLCNSCHQNAEWEWRRSNPVQLGLALDGARCSPSKPKYPIDISGVRFGDLIAKSRAPDGKSNCARWNVYCERCDNSRVVWRGSLISGSSVDCGCRLRERRESRKKELAAENAAKRIMPRYWWHVDGQKYRVLTDAAEAHGVSQATIENWCHGPRRKNGPRGPRKQGCWAELRSETERPRAA